MDLLLRISNQQDWQLPFRYEVSRAFLMTDLLISIILNGLFLGLSLLLVALGITLMLGIMRIVNIAHGEFFMLSGMIVWYMVVRVGVSYWLGLLAAIIIASILGIGLERYLLRRFRGNLISGFIACMGVIMIMQTGASLLFGFPPKSIPSQFQGNIAILGLPYATERLVILLISSALAIAALLLVQSTKLGRAMRAVSQDELAAALQGVSVGSICRVTMALGCVLAAVAGGLMAPIFLVSAFMGMPLLLKALVAMVIGGWGSVGGVIIGSLFIGMLESALVTLASSEIATMVLFSILIAVLIVRPTGLLGAELRE